MIEANKIFHLRQVNDPNHPLLARIGMTPTKRSIESQLQTIFDYRFKEVFFVSELEEHLRVQLLEKGLRLTKICLEKHYDDPDNVYLIDHAESLKKFKPEDKVIWMMSSTQRPTIQQLQNLLHQWKNLYFYFSPKIDLEADLLSCREIYKLIKRIEPLQMRLYPGLNVFETRAPDDLIFYPRDGVLWSIGGDSKVMHSVIIPVYGQKMEALRTIERLMYQTTKQPYEIIIVDDGDNQDLSLKLKSLLAQKNQISKITYLVNPRIYPRRMGDHRFRAGISRNFAMRFALGDNIHFLDADVLVPRTYIDTVSEELQSAELVQIQRYDLTKEFTASLQPIEDIKEDVDLIYRGRDYWYTFFEKGTHWMELRYPWKYVCTYGISMRKDYLLSLGGIRTNYIFYGFEDTDLGFRVWQSGGRFKLSEVKSYHQFHEEKRSEFKNSNRLRRRLMAQSGKLFFLNNLKPEIYEELIDYLFPRYSLGDWMSFLFLSWWREPKKIRPKKIPAPLTN
jgi:glycosyltransferase involved in cell wall biosynthesis